MLKQKLLRFYSENKEVLEDMVKVSQNREVGYVMENGNFGKRPYIIENESDIIHLIKNNNALSFHVSVERWYNPLNLSAKLKKKELNELRLGWDLVIDLDSKNIEIAKYATLLIYEFLEGNNIEPIYVKYSGGKGFHIVVPWELFPDRVMVEKKEELVEEETRKLFPELARTISSYIASKIENKLRKYIEKKWSISELIKELGLNILEEQFSPFHVVEIDTILISSRHLFRLVYSINEKTGRLSIPLRPRDILNLDLEYASIDNYSYEGLPFLTEEVKKENKMENIIYDAIKWEVSNKIDKEKLEAITRLSKSDAELEEELEKDIKRTKVKFGGKVPEEYFPPCIKNILSGIEDGRKRAVFVLINFLANLGWSWEDIEKKLNEWNNNNPDPLRDRYIEYQLEWHKERYKKELKYLTPNCANEIYYKDIGVCKPDEICNMIKNPLSYPLKKLKVDKYKKSEEQKQKK